MTPERWRAVRRVFEHAVELDSGSRSDYLGEACGDDGDLRQRVEQMLAALEEESTLLERPAIRLGEEGAGAGPAAADAGSAMVLPRTIGPYRLVERLGRGGMGEVFLAHRADDTFHKEVAIKLLRHRGESEELARRFRRERQILATLEHPNIAQLLDGGTAEDGSPYLVMEHVRGRAIDTYCREENLDVAARLALFVQICDGVQFAHQSLVVHRDLKPGNILVTDGGEPKLLDFGIAKLLQPETFPQTVMPTRTGLVPMTPAYASPEQVRGQAVTTATDVYALGILLYELLTGSRPYEVDGGNLDTLVEAVCHREPPKPSTAVRSRAGDADPDVPEGTRTDADSRRLSRLLRGDLDAIVMKALAKEPLERYGSAAQLRDDLGRHLEGLPVSARRGTFVYHTGKLVRRYRWAVGGVAAAFLALSAFVVILLDQQRRLLEENHRTRVQFARAEVVSDWITELFELPAPSRSRGETITARELLDKGAQSIDDGTLLDDPGLRAELEGTIGHTYAKLGLLDEGVAHLEASVALHRRARDGDPAALARRLQQLSDALVVDGEYARALPLARQASSLRAAREQPDSVTEEGSEAGVDLASTADSLARLGHLHDLLGEYALARPLLDEALVLARRSGESEILAKALEFAAEVRMGSGEIEEARQLYGESLALWVEVQGDRHPETVLLRASTALAARSVDYPRAEALLRQAIGEQRKLFEGAHPVLATALNNLGLVLHEQGRLQEAREVHQQALEMQAELFGADHPKSLASEVNLALTDGALGRLDEAESRCRQACEGLAQRLGEDHPEAAQCTANLATILLRGRRAAEARPLLEQAGARLLAKVGPDHPRLAGVLNSRGQVDRLLGDLEGARGAFEQAEAVARQRRVLALLPSVLFNLGVVLTELEEPSAAAERLSETVEILLRRSDAAAPPPMLALQAETRLAALWVELGELEKAEKAARRAHGGWLEMAGPANLWTLSAQGSLGRALLRQGRVDEAEPVLMGLLQELESSQPPTSRRLRRAYGAVVELWTAAGDDARAADYAKILESLPQNPER